MLKEPTLAGGACQHACTTGGTCHMQAHPAALPSTTPPHHPPARLAPTPQPPLRLPDTLIVYAKTAPDRGAHGITAFIIEKGMKVCKLGPVVVLVVVIVVGECGGWGRWWWVVGGWVRLGEWMQDSRMGACV